MQSIHVDTEELYRTARAFWQNNLGMADQIYSLRTAMIRLDMAWQGSAAEQFSAELSQLVDRLNDHAEEAVSLGLTLSRQSEMWDESDQRWTQNYSSIIC